MPRAKPSSNGWKRWGARRRRGSKPQSAVGRPLAPHRGQVAGTWSRSERSSTSFRSVTTATRSAGKGRSRSGGRCWTTSESHEDRRDEGKTPEPTVVDGRRLREGVQQEIDARQG